MAKRDQLAINGGPKAKTCNYGTGKRFDGNELDYLRQALEQNTLFYGSGKFVKQSCEMMKTYTGLPYVVACTSGSAAIHLGLIAAGIGPGDEVIMTPNTDSGTALGVIEEGAVPVFCDCGKHLQPTAQSVAARITNRTKAVVVVHLAGMPAPVDEIVEVCRPRGVAVVEDCAQSWGARLKGKSVGTFGTAGCWSVNDYKHISTGDGGFVGLSEADLYRRVHNYADKHYDRFFDRSQMQAYHGMNYRMSELAGAVACAQLEKVDAITSRQHDRGELLRAKLAGMPGGRILEPIAGGYGTYWWSAAFVDDAAVTAGRDEIVSAIAHEGVSISSFAKYDLIQKPLFQNRIVRPWLTGDRAMYPFVQPDGRKYTYSHDATPTHKELLRTGMMISMNTFYTEQDIIETAAGIRKVFEAFAK